MIWWSLKRFFVSIFSPSFRPALRSLSTQVQARECLLSWAYFQLASNGNKPSTDMDFRARGWGRKTTSWPCPCPKLEMMTMQKGMGLQPLLSLRGSEREGSFPKWVQASVRCRHRCRNEPKPEASQLWRANVLQKPDFYQVNRQEAAYSEARGLNLVSRPHMATCLASMSRWTSPKTLSCNLPWNSSQSWPEPKMHY